MGREAVELRRWLLKSSHFGSKLLLRSKKPPQQETCLALLSFLGLLLFLSLLVLNFLRVSEVKTAIFHLLELIRICLLCSDGFKKSLCSPNSSLLLSKEDLCCFTSETSMVLAMKESPSHFSSPLFAYESRTIPVHSPFERSGGTPESSSGHRSLHRPLGVVRTHEGRNHL